MTYCIFLNKNNRAVNVGVFESEDEALAHFIKAENGYKDFVFSEENVQLYSTWDGKNFTAPDDDFIAKFNQTGAID